MRVRAAAVGFVLLGILVGCTPTESTPSPTAEPTTEAPLVEVAPVGEAALPVGCSDLLADADVIDLGTDVGHDVRLVVDEDHIAIDMSVADLQIGTLRCVWASRYAASDFHSEVRLRITPTSATALDPAAEHSNIGSFTPLEGSSDALISCSESRETDISAFYNMCEALQLRGGYRVELTTSGLRAAVGYDPSVTIALLAEVVSAVDAAAPARTVEAVSGTADPTEVCTSPELAPVLAYLSAAGDPAIEASDTYPGVSRCVWGGVDEHGFAGGPSVSMLSGGAWAMQRLTSGVSTFWVPTRPSADGTFLVGVGEGVTAWRAVGEDLVFVWSGDHAVAANWESFLEATW